MTQDKDGCSSFGGRSTFPRCSRITERLLAAAFAAAMWAIPTASGQGGPGPSAAYIDPDYDVVVRRTDAGVAAPFNAVDHGLPNILEIVLGRWEPVAADVDLFAGSFVSSGGFVRLDIRFEGLINPPGDTHPMSFEPFVFGPNPVYGFIELDVDGDNATGGETEAPEYRYLANIARFGGLPEGAAFTDRLAGEGADLDEDFVNPPYIERSGEEFHLALVGGQFTWMDVVEVGGDGDLAFEAGETWDISASWLHRAHGFEPYSLAEGGAAPGEYAPTCVLRFSHDDAQDRTSVSLVFPLTNNAAAAMFGEPVQPYNHDPSDHASIFEALRDLRESAVITAMFPTGEPEEALILGWQSQGPGSYMNPHQWRMTALVGTSYEAAGHGFVWTDAYPNVLRGNVDGLNGVNEIDEQQAAAFIAAHDGQDGLVDGRYVLADFAADFSVYDINHDGVVEDADLMLVSPAGDADGDGDVDLADFATFQQCIGLGNGSAQPSCVVLDLNGDGMVNLGDYRWFGGVLTGPPLQ